MFDSLLILVRREVKGKVYKAYVKEKKEAKADYDQAVQFGQAAGHVALE